MVDPVGMISNRQGYDSFSDVPELMPAELHDEIARATRSVQLLRQSGLRVAFTGGQAGVRPRLLDLEGAVVLELSAEEVMRLGGCAAG